ncbi:hypothetical protein MMC11_007738 [Xylographa trunciseda]|nr:hypothetical protein [Xylographa trunciseda]
MSYKMSFLEATKVRRSTITLTNTSPISDNTIVNIVSHAIKHAPSPFNVQSGRAIVLFKKEHEKLWDIAKESVMATLPPPVLATILPKVAEYRGAYGTVSYDAHVMWTVMFFEDPTASAALPPQLQGLMAKYPDWYEHSSGMSQFIAWTALCAEGLGCNLQHYQPGISAAVREEWNVPESWSLRAQLVFGTPTGPPRGGVNKEFAPLEPRLKGLAPRKSHSKNPNTPPRYCSDRCRNHRPRSSVESIERQIEDTFVKLLSGDPSTPISLSATRIPKTKASKGDPRRLVLCGEVEHLVFKNLPDPNRVYGRQKNRPKRGVRDEAEWKSVDMEDRSTVSRQDSDDSYSSDDDVGEVSGVPVRLYPLQNASQKPELNAARTDNSRMTTSSETSHPPASPSVSAELEARRAGQQRAEERELVRQAARRGVAFGFIFRNGTSDTQDGAGQKVPSSEEKRKCEAVQNGRVVEASFAKGDWGLRWRE